MTSTATAPERRTLRRRRIIERPRLLALLDGSKARTKLLVAPAGYGKTTLAEQWVARDGRRSVWYTARSSSRDVAALALGLARCASALVQGCDHRLREHLRAVPAPDENVATLAEILAEDLATWPGDAWLVLDDYHEISGEPKAEQFVAALVAGSPVQALVASRQRPSWVATKGILYGSVLELGQTVLAMDAAEAAEVLVDRSAPSASGLVALANGWPAVIGLASVSTAEITSEAEQVPESLYHYFADEVFSALGEEVQQGLMRLAAAPLLDRDLAGALLGADEADLVCAAALDVGILVERGAQLDLHPLARSFLEERGEQLGLMPARDAAEVCLQHYLARREWDAAFDVIERDRLSDRLEGLVLVALDELADGARLSTVERWCALAASWELEGPGFSLARAELLLRRGRHVEAMAHAQAASQPASGLTFRALALAGRAAHLASREEEALELYREAEKAASTDGERRDALWGQLICLIELEDPKGADLLQLLLEGSSRTSVRDMFQAATYGLSFQQKLGNLDLADADLAWTMVDAVSDPLLVTAFQSTYSVGLTLTGRYRDALDVSEAFLATTEQYRLDFAVPYALCSGALAGAGLRRWADADALSRRALRLAHEARDGHLQQLCVAQWMRALAQQGRHHEALALELPVVRSPIAGAHAEVVVSRALVLAALARVRDALELLEPVRDLSQAIEPVVLSYAIDAICALKEQRPDAIDRVRELERVAFARGADGLLVTAYRCAPEILSVLVHVSADRGRLAALIRRAGDIDLVGILGDPLFSDEDPRSQLTRREREVYELLVTGRTNREIAKLLFIEESTAKVHVHHIYDKLGVRSRTALQLRAALERTGQATSAMGSTGSPADSS